MVAADGTLTRETFAANPKAPIDCFYVYPTISTDPTDNSDMTADPAELNVVAQQFARFSSVCRPFAPLYRQLTLVGLRKRLAGASFSFERGVQYDDVRDAWRHYLQHDNQGRGVVIIGHSQGSYVLMEVIRQEVEGKPVQKQLVSALILGATLEVPKGKDVGGAFKSIPLCRKPGQIGCVVNFSAFRSTVTPPANTLFGKAQDPAVNSGSCTNPATLGEGSAPLRAYLSNSGRTIVGTVDPETVGRRQDRRHPVGQRARIADGEVRDERKRDLPRDHRQRQPGGPARRRHHRRPRRGRQSRWPTGACT